MLTIFTLDPVLCFVALSKNKVEFNYMVAEALTRAQSCFNQLTGGYGDEEKWRSSRHAGPPGANEA